MTSTNLSPKQLNFAHLVLACVDVIKKPLIDILDIYIKPNDLSKKVIESNDLISGRHKLNSEQQIKCGLASQDLPVYYGFDVTLLYALIRNLCPMSLTPTKGWGKKPQETDTQIGDDIERIRLFRNENLAHANSGELEDTQFENHWKYLEDVIKRIQCFTTRQGCNTDYLQQLSNLKGRTVEIDEYTLVIKSLQEENEAMKKEKTSVIPSHVKDGYKLHISTWKKDDDVYVETHNFPAMFKQVQNNSYVTIVGVPGSGKTATAHHIALKLHDEEGYEIVPIKEVAKLEDYCDPYNPQVFVIDNVVGGLFFSKNEFNTLQKYEKNITKPIMEKTKIIMTCRTIVFRDDTLSKCFLTEKENVIQLQDQKNRLNNEDKLSLLEKYGLTTVNFPSTRMSETSDMFPFLCKMYPKEKSHDHGYMFFIIPISCMKNELDSLQTQNKILYVSLVLLMLNQNKLSETALEKHRTKTSPNDIEYVYKKCKLESYPDSSKIADAIKQMEGIYTHIWGDQFYFIHDSIFEIVAWHFGCQFPELILKYMTSEYIAKYIEVDTNDGKMNESESKEMLEDIETLSITLHESKLSKLAERLFTDLKKGELYEVFKALKHPSVMQAFQNMLMEKQYNELFNVILPDKVDNKLRLFHRPDLLGIMYWEIDDLSSLFFGGMVNNDQHRQCVRAIRWFVFCGQHGILQHIIEQMMKQKGNINDLFQTFCGRNGDEDSEPESKSDNDIHSEQMNFEQWRLLCLGCFSGDVKTVKVLLKYVNKVVINMYEKDQQSLFDLKNNPLAIACNHGYSDIVKELIRAGANVNLNMNDQLDYAYLSHACRSGKVNLDIVKECIKAGADVNKGNAISTHLIDACKNKNLNAVRLLLKAGANSNLKANEKTPLQVSYNNEYVKIADELIKTGANNNFENGVQSLTTASCDGQSISIENRNNTDIVVNPNQKITSTTYKTPLIVACKKKYFRTVKLLIEAGADINKGDGHETPLDVACQYRDLKIIKMLIKAEAYVNPIDVNMSPLMVACYDGDLQCVKEWIKDSTLLNSKTENGNPLIIACEKHHINVVNELIKAGANVNLEAGGETPLTAVLGSNCSMVYFGPKDNMLDIVKALIQEGADLNQIAGERTPLIIACQRRYSKVVEVLINAGADVNIKAGEQTPLTSVLNSYESENHRWNFNEKKIDVVKVLLKAKADFNQKAGNKTPLTIACQKGYNDVVDEFIKSEGDFNLAAQDKTQLTDVCKEININVKEWLEKIGDLRYKSQLLTACLRQQLNIADLLKTDGYLINFKDDGNASLTSKCLMEHLREDLVSFLMKTSCQIGRLRIVKELIKVGVDLNLRYGDKMPIIAACQKGHVDVIKELIKAGVDVDLKEGCKIPLTVAIKKMQINAVKELIQAGAVVNLESSNETPLTAACELYNRHMHPTASLTQQIEIMEELIQAGVDINMKAGDKTPLTIVCRKGNINAVKLFLKSGADVNLEADGKTPLTTACQVSHLDVIEELINAGANVNQKDKHNTPLTAAMSHDLRTVLQILGILIKAGADVNLQNTDNTPLTLACQEGSMRVIVALINAGADVNHKAGHTRPLTVACTEGHFDVVKYLIKAGACVNLEDGVKTPLEIAYERKHMRIAEWLVNAGASIKFKNDVFAPIIIGCQMGRISDVTTMIKAGIELNPSNVDKTPLTAACQKGDLRLVKELINAGASVNLIDRFGTPLTTACLWGHVSVVKELIYSGASVNMIDKYNSPLTTACLWGHLDIVKELIRTGSNVNLRDVCNTPLTTACFWGELDIVKELIEYGADVNLKDEENTPLTIACLKNRIDIVKELIKAKADVNLECGDNTPLTVACQGGDIMIIEVLIEAGADVNLGVEV